MIRRFGLLLLTLPVTAAFPVMSAQAQQYYPAPPPGYRAAPPPPPGYFAEEDDVVVVRPRMGPIRRLFTPRYGAPTQIQAEQVDAQALPPPGLSAPPGQGQGYGHQLDGRPQGAPAVQADPDTLRPPAAVGSLPNAAPQPGQPATSVMTLPPEDQPEQGQPKELPANLKKQLVDFTTKEPAGTIIVDTANTYLYLVLGGGKAMRYGIGVGREGFTWTGTERVSKMKEWPDWFPPAEMIERQPYLPRMMAGGPGNPLGARALYLGKTLYRIHGTNQPSTIGSYVSSGCIRLLNEDIEDLYSRVQTGTRVVVLPGKAPDAVASSRPPEPANPMAPPSRAGVQGTQQGAQGPQAEQVVGAPTSIAPPGNGNLPPITSSALPPPTR
jgi:lipoprotein-anchoring transpeptidase ErfK/SrfK